MVSSESHPFLVVLSHFEARVLADEHLFAPVFSCQASHSGHRREKAFLKQSYVIKAILLILLK
jgi:hypothetical protein